MKKIYQTALFAFLCNLAMAQSFFVPTTYRGAFEPNVAMWTDNWTNWDPQNTVYANATDTVKTSITTNTTWTANKTYILSGQIYVKNGATLTIQPGTVIQGNKASTGAGLFICQGAKIMAKGTAAQPIVFTSNQAAGSRAQGDWGGIILMGKASNNQTGGIANIEGLAATPETQFGGGLSPDDADNSGVLSYVRIEWGGYVYQPNKEINGLTFGSVGSGTTIDHIQVSFSNDDAFEWFGGKVTCKYLVSYRNLDDDFDTDFGFGGKVQFALSVRDPNIADAPAVSTSEGFESDNDASGSTATPQTSAIFSNITLIGPYRGNTSSTIAAGYRRGARIRRNSALKIYNSIFMDHKNGVHIDGSLCVALAQAGSLKFKNNIVAGNSTGHVLETTSGFPFSGMDAWFAATSKNDSLVSSANILTTPYNYTAPDYRPAVGSIALTGADFTDIMMDPFVLKAPTASNVAYCKGATASALTATAASGNTLWWYTAATGGTGSMTAPTPSTATVGVTTYYVSQSEVYGGESARTAVTVTINALPVVTITAKGSTSLCTGSSVVLKSSSATGNVWSTTATADSITVSSTGSYTVTVTDNNTCVATSAATVVSVSSAPLPTVSVSGALSFCEGDSVVLTSSTADSYQWANSAGTTKSITVKTSGTYNVTTTNTDACAGVGQSADVVITVGTVPVAAAAIVSKSGNVLTFSNSSTGATSYKWEFGDFESSAATTPVHAYATNGKYTITLTASKGTCSDMVTLMDTINVGIAEIKGGSLSIYPNPVNEQATFELNMTESHNISVNVYDITGQLVASVYQGEVSVGTTKLTLNTSNLRSGIYFTSITSENTQKIVKMIVE